MEAKRAMLKQKREEAKEKEKDEKNRIIIKSNRNEKLNSLLIIVFLALGRYNCKRTKDRSCKS